MQYFLLGLALVAILLFALAIGIAWAPDRPVDDLKARWAPPPSIFVQVQGMTVHLRDEGRATGALPILLLHGTSSSLHTWDGWAEALVPTRRVVRVDLPGFGLTGPFPDGDYNVTRYVAFVIALLDHLEIPQVIVAGNSFGGQLAWELATAAPERVAALILVDAAGYPLAPSSIPIGFRIALNPTLQPIVNYLLPRRVVAASIYDVYGNPALVTDELVDRYYELALREGNRRALSRRLEQAVKHEARADRITMVARPTLILWGGQDRLFPPDFATRFASDIAASQLVVFDALGHVGHEEDPAATVAVVQRFLDELEAQRQ